MRFVIAYLALYMLPFPITVLGTVARLPLIGDIPGFATAVGGIISGWYSLLSALADVTGRLLLGVDVEVGPSGSGDRLVNYVTLIVTVALALAISIVWTLATRGRRVGAGAFDVSRVLSRYYLATTLLVYGWLKVFPLQMPTPGPDRLLQPYGDSSPMGIAWTFIGASTAYE
ncbi:MAG: hypothetical protein R3195_04890, partial [Gemmatimonadota bacterium]|nr:hypothetical protein [Gemmatimonadota bacterium]